MYMYLKYIEVATFSPWIFFLFILYLKWMLQLLLLCFSPLKAYTSLILCVFPFFVFVQFLIFVVVIVLGTDWTNEMYEKDRNKNKNTKNCAIEFLMIFISLFTTRLAFAPISLFHFFFRSIFLLFKTMFPISVVVFKTHFYFNKY